LETLLFYHPAVWWVSRVARIEREHCCDDVAVRVAGGATLYAETLTLLEERRGAPYPSLSATGGLLMNRIRRVLGLSSAPLRPSAAFATAVLLLGFVVLLGSSIKARATDTHAKRNSEIPKPQSAQDPHTMIVLRGPALANASAEGATDTQAQPAAPDAHPQPEKGTRYYRLPFDSVDEFLADIESGALRLPEGVTVTLKEEANVSPRYALAGDRAGVDQAIKAIGRLLKHAPPTPLLIHSQIWFGSRLVSAPNVRDLDGMPATVREDGLVPATGLTDIAMRICPKCGKDGTISLWASLQASGLRLVIPFALSAQEDLAVVRDQSDNVVLTAVDLKTKFSRSVPLPQDWKPLAGLRLTINAEVDKDLAGMPTAEWTGYVPSESVMLTLKGPFAEVVQLAAKEMGIRAVVEPGTYKELPGGAALIKPTLTGAEQRRQWEQIANMLCSNGNATCELRDGMYYFKPAPAGPAGAAEAQKAQGR
jgi:hypothetical protein